MENAAAADASSVLPLMPAEDPPPAIVPMPADAQPEASAVLASDGLTAGLTAPALGSEALGSAAVKEAAACPVLALQPACEATHAATPACEATVAAPPKGGASPPIAPSWVFAALLVLTVASGAIDAVTFLRFDRVFVANMTGNILFLGFAVNPSSGLSPASQAVALAGFIIGVSAGSRIGRALASQPRTWLITALGTEAVLLALVAILMAEGVFSRTVLPAIGVLAVGLGIQLATARRLAVPDVSTAVLTMTLTGLVADSVFGGGSEPQITRRLGSIACILLGAIAGSLLIQVSTAGAIGLAAALVFSASLLLFFAPRRSPAAPTAGATK